MKKIILLISFIFVVLTINAQFTKSTCSQYFEGNIEETTRRIHWKTMMDVSYKIKYNNEKVIVRNTHKYQIKCFLIDEITEDSYSETYLAVDFNDQTCLITFERHDQYLIIYIEYTTEIYAYKINK